VPVTGLTSAGHYPFVAGGVLADIAGNTALRDRIGRHAGRSARSWLHVVRHRGLGSAGDLYQAVPAGRAGSPADAHVVDVAGDSHGSGR
jgi:hypothetical protein